jgi:hypothetical protein
MSYPSVNKHLEAQGITPTAATDAQMAPAFLAAFREDLPFGMTRVDELVSKTKSTGQRAMVTLNPNSEEGKQFSRLLGADIGRSRPAGKAALDKRALVLVAILRGLDTTKFYGPWHQAKNTCGEETQPLLLLRSKGGGKRLPCVGKLFELRCPVSQCVSAVTHRIDRVGVTLIATLIA